MFLDVFNDCLLLNKFSCKKDQAWALGWVWVWIFLLVCFGVRFFSGELLFVGLLGFFWFVLVFFVGLFFFVKQTFTGGDGACPQHCKGCGQWEHAHGWEGHGWASGCLVLPAVVMVLTCTQTQCRPPLRIILRVRKRE